MKPPVLVSGGSKSGDENLCKCFFSFIAHILVLWGWEEGAKRSVGVDFKFTD